MKFDFWTFVLDNLEAAGTIGGYVSLSIIGFALVSFAAKKRHDSLQVKLALGGCILSLAHS